MRFGRFISFVELKTSVFLYVLLRVFGRWGAIFRRVSHECLAALYISRVSALSWPPACTCLIRPFWMKEFVDQYGNSYTNGKLDYPFAFILYWFVSDKLLTLWPHDSQSLGLQDDICPFFGIISFHTNRFAFISPKSFSSSVNHLILSLSIFLLLIGFLVII